MSAGEKGGEGYGGAGEALSARLGGCQSGESEGQAAGERRSRRRQHRPCRVPITLRYRRGGPLPLGS
ncbi:hypothetical protein ES705_39444 [subsurface metagenome]